MSPCNTEWKRNMNWKRAVLWFLIVSVARETTSHQWMAWGPTSCFLPRLAPWHQKAVLNRVGIKQNKCTPLLKRKKWAEFSNYVLLNMAPQEMSFRDTINLRSWQHMVTKDPMPIFIGWNTLLVSLSWLCSELNNCIRGNIPKFPWRLNMTSSFHNVLL